MHEHFGNYVGQGYLVRLLLQRGLALIYLVAFLSALNQFRPLLGERGLLPVPRFLARSSFRSAPSLFHFHYSDRLFGVVAWSGIALSMLALLGLSEAGPLWLSFLVWITLWFLYLSIVNVGQTFYGFGWESMLLEAGFFVSFLGPASVDSSALPILALRFMLFRTELGAGLIKLRHDPCWRDLTCLYFHHETQPLPNPLSWHFHHLPRFAHRAGVAFSHFVQVVVPFGLFLPQPFATGAGAAIIFHQLLLIVSGNYSWLNWLTVVLGVSAVDEAVLRALLSFEPPAMHARALPYEIALYAMAIATLALGVKPVLNFFDRNQRMNYSYNPLHLVNAYGAFGSVTRERYEVVLEGSENPSALGGGEDEDVADESDAGWKEYELKAKPGDPKRRPPLVAPYHLRLDWLMWFLPLGGVARHERWFLVLLQKLLEGDPEVIKLLGHNPFPNAPPRVVRALLYRYHFTTPEERKATSAFWKRQRIGEFIEPISLDMTRR